MVSRMAATIPATVTEPVGSAMRATRLDPVEALRYEQQASSLSYYGQLALGSVDPISTSSIH